MSRLRDQSGMTLVELLVSMVLGLLILAATLLVIDATWRNDRRAQIVNEQQQSVRISLERMARQLRNLASPTVLTSGSTTLPRSVERNLPNDLIFQDVDNTKPTGSLNSANVRRVRYCLDVTDPANETLWMQTQTWITAAPPTMPTATECPGAGWDAGKNQAVAQNVTNALPSTPRPVFTYSGDGGVITTTDSDSRADINRIGAHLYLRAPVKNPPVESELMTSVFLRNQNREPQAKFTLTVLNPTTGAIQLNGSASQDPEGRPLEYVWNIDGTDHPTKGVLVQLSLPPGSHTIYLKAFDPAGLEGDSATQTVTL
jgi:prepilin-type N-terminal cleavage/methylation domain-containing protein